MRTRRVSRRAGATAQALGLRVFRGRTTQFQPLLCGPVPDSYRVGPGDVMVLVLTGDLELVHQLQVTREGFVVIPQVGQLYVSGLTITSLRQVFADRLGRSYSGIRRGTTHFDITIARLRTIQAFVIGEVVQPGAYQLSSVATVMNALYAAGGPTTLGGYLGAGSVVAVPGKPQGEPLNVVGLLASLAQIVGSAAVATVAIATP